MWTRKDKDHGEANRGLKNARENLEKVKSRGDEVSQVAQELKTARERNHFAEQLQLIFTGHGRKL